MSPGFKSHAIIGSLFGKITDEDGDQWHPDDSISDVGDEDLPFCGCL